MIVEEPMRTSATLTEIGRSASRVASRHPKGYRQPHPRSDAETADWVEDYELLTDTEQLAGQKHRPEGIGV